MIRPTVSLTLLAALALPFGAVAQDVGQHPAVFAPRALPGVDASTFIVGHPASPRFVAGHANHEHPAVTAHDAARPLDTGRYLVQPPASTRWVTTAVTTPLAVR
jgi:hypothetical protein